MADDSVTPDRAPVRIPFVAACTLQTATGRRSALVRNLSSQGLYVHLEEELEGEVELSFPLPDGGPPVRVRAVARWSKEVGEESTGPFPVGCGFRFVDVAASDQGRIDRLVAAHASQPGSIAGITQPRSGAARVPLITSCRLAGAWGEASGHTCNLSIFGVYAAVAPIPEVGESVELRLVLPGDSEPFVHRATVTWRNPGMPARPHLLPAGCGLRFDDLGLGDIRLLAQIVDGYLARLADPG